MEVYTSITFLFEAAPDVGAVADRRGARDDPGERQQPREQPEAVLRRRREHAGAELRDELVLDLALRVAGGDPAADVDAHARGDRRVGHVEREVAGGEQDLAPEVPQRRGAGPPGAPRR